MGTWDKRFGTFIVRVRRRHEAQSAGLLRQGHTPGSPTLSGSYAKPQKSGRTLADYVEARRGEELHFAQIGVLDTLVVEEARVRPNHRRMRD